jgi:hypothetical protein
MLAISRSSIWLSKRINKKNRIDKRKKNQAKILKIEQKMTISDLFNIPRERVDIHSTSTRNTLKRKRSWRNKPRKKLRKKRN